MKMLIMIFAILNTSLVAFSQDSVILKRGDTLNVFVTKSSSESIEFKYPEEDVLNTLSKKRIVKIIYQSGRTENVNKVVQLPTIKSKDDWEKVIITFDPIDVEGYKELGTVTRKSGWGGVVSVEAGELVMKKMKKDAAELGSPIILIVEGWHMQKNKPISGYGRGVKLVGKAYR